MDPPRACVAVGESLGFSWTFRGASGRIEMAEAELIDTGPASPNLLANGDFESLDEAVNVGALLRIALARQGVDAAALAVLAAALACSPAQSCEASGS